MQTIVAYTPFLVGLGTAINVVAVLVAAGLGTLVGTRLPEGMRETAMRVIRIVTLLIGVSYFLELTRASTQPGPTLTLTAVQ